MANAKDARAWAPTALLGMGDSLYTPFSGKDGDDVDYDAYRELVRYCVGTLNHPMLWLTSGLAEFWSLTMDERKKLLEIAVDEARAINPNVVIQACTASTCAKDALELTLHAQEYGADIAYIQTPMMEVHGGEGVQRFFQYIADRTDIALGLFNSGSSGYILSPADIKMIYDAIPAICAIKDGTFQVARTPGIKAACPDLHFWECDALSLTAGWAASGIVCKSLLGTAGWMFDFPNDPRGTTYYNLLWDGKIEEAIAYGKKTVQYDEAHKPFGKWMTSYPGRPGYFTHWGEVSKVAAGALGLPVGDYPFSRPPQGILPEAARVEIRTAIEKAGLKGVATPYVGKAAAKQLEPA